MNVTSISPAPVASPVVDPDGVGDVPPAAQSFIAALMAQLVPAVPPDIASTDGAIDIAPTSAAEPRPVEQLPVAQAVPAQGIADEEGASEAAAVDDVVASWAAVGAPFSAIPDAGRPAGPTQIEGNSSRLERPHLRQETSTLPVVPRSISPMAPAESPEGKQSPPASMLPEILATTADRLVSDLEPPALETAVAPPSAAPPAPIGAPPASGGGGVLAVAQRPTSIATPAALPDIVVRAVHDGQDRIRVALVPEELGRVAIDLTVGDDGRLRASFTVERPETLQMLQRDQRSLAQTLTDAGVSIADAGLSFSLTDGHHDRRGDERAPPRPADIGGDAAPPKLAMPDPTMRSAGPAGLLDLTV